MLVKEVCSDMLMGEMFLMNFLELHRDLYGEGKTTEHRCNKICKNMNNGYKRQKWEEFGHLGEAQSRVVAPLH